MIKQNKTHFRPLALIFFSLCMTMIVAFVDINALLYSTSILSYPEHQPFDGTVYPVKKVPNWVKLDSSKWDKSFAELSNSDFVDLPQYDAEKLKSSTDTLKWNNVEDDKVRVMKITYSVPYMGSYALNGLEYAGSHPAVDIKIPSGTPLYAIANGTVIKASNQNSGFGHHIVIRHTNFPTLDDPGKKTIIYSSYSHMSDLSVAVGDVVIKGQQIGLSGKTGTATTPHLHFQVDTEEAPWHPFWPFTWQEASDAGYSFFEAINAGLGKEKALTTTVNPLKYIAKYFDATAKVLTDDGAKAVSYVAENDIKKTETEIKLDNSVAENTLGEQVSDVSPTEEVPTTAPVVEEEVKGPINFEIKVNEIYYVGQTANFTVYLRDKDGKALKDGFLGEVIISSDKGNATVKQSILSAIQFDSDAKSKNAFSRLSEGRDRVKISFNGEAFYSDWFEIEKGDEDKIFSDVSDGHKYFEAIGYLARNGIISGYADGMFRSAKTVNRVEALKFILEGIDTKLATGDLPFIDTNNSEWYASYLYTGFKNKIVNGDPDGRFRPADTINKAEFLKILFSGMKVQVADSVVSKPYDDVEITDWFAPYIAKARDLGILDNSVDFIYPSNSMSRGEVADAIWRVIKK